MKRYLPLIRRFLPIPLGLAAGFGYWYFIGCSSGHCPITSNWYSSVLYGGLIGSIFVFDSKKKKADTPTPEGE